MRCPIRFVGPFAVPIMKLRRRDERDMGIRFSCPNGHRLNVKAHLAGKRGICPQCGIRVDIPLAGELQGATHQTADSLQRAGGGSSTSPPSLLEIGSQSIIIPVAEPTLVAPPPLESFELPDLSPRGGPAAADAGGPPIDSPMPPTPIGPKRPTSRRNQIVLAIVLLIAVLLLAAVLVWVLARNSTPAPESRAAAPATHYASHLNADCRA
jgi:hypothetical protein